MKFSKAMNYPASWVKAFEDPQQEDKNETISRELS